ncbi:DUF1273 domain-containing protein [Paenibacillus sp. LHD-117]|uniref:DUF1273 domain-containing protein n=1 Tax=Paenibacillus sp. LHD-117 TaxID=3071412 RepID=UPI0027DFDDAE|nr:DUF1273 domain-containing protein [Paenibacillus sp. LHD-117]MDQ6421818.1 DUF1273 domain-containing protein [Paenibacillus sp. LHD-117]
MKTVLITGYRAHELSIFSQKHKGIAFIQKAIANKLVPLLEEGLEWVITPGQYGVDLWACEAAIALKRQYPGLKVSILTAFQNPEENWKEDKQTYYRELLKDVDYYAAVSKAPYEGPWQFKARDELLLRKSDGIILVYDEDAGEGSPRFMKERAVRKMQEDGYRYISVTSEDIQSIADEDAYRDME